jgi:cobalt-zinc-cadmium efflux system protein
MAADHHHHDHPHHVKAPQTALTVALALTLVFAGIEAVAGLWAQSLALLGDAGHMLTDSLALGLAALAASLARRPPSHRHSFGLARIEVLAALVNAGFMFAVVIGIAWTAAQRLLAPRPVAGDTVAVVALAGLAVNIVAAWILSRGEQTLNTRGALLHVLGDMLGSIAALAAGLVIMLTGWTPIDPLLSILICVLILASTLRLAHEAVHTLIEGVPEEISLPDVARRMAQVPGVLSLHDLHIWALSSSRVALSAHVVVRQFSDWERLLPELRALLHDDFGIDHVTLQPELAAPTVVPLPDPTAPRRRA